MKLICVDGNEANVTQPVGVSVYTNNILHQFKHYADHDIRFCVYLRKKPLLHLPRENQYFRYRIVRGPCMWNRFFLPFALWRDYMRQRMRHFLDKRTIWFHSFLAPAHYAPPWLPPKCKLVVTIHDLAFLFYPDEFLKKDLYKLTNWTAEAVHQAEHIIAVSEHTKQDIINQYHIAPQHIRTIPNGFASQKLTSPETSIPWMVINGHKYDIETREYILYVGTLQPRKNIKTLLYAFALFHKEHPEQKLIIAGKKGWMYEDIFSTVKKFKIDHVVHFVGYVNEVDKNKLYAHALAFVLPSLYEGFGFPLLEAFAASCPVICSNTSSLPEVGGDAALYFDPMKPNDLVDRLREIERDFKMRQDMIDKGLNRLRNFSWEKCAEHTLEMLLK